MPRALDLAEIRKGCLVVLAIGGVAGMFSCVLALEASGMFGRWPRASDLSAGGVPGLLI